MGRGEVSAMGDSMGRKQDLRWLCYERSLYSLTVLCETQMCTSLKAFLSLHFEYRQSRRGRSQVTDSGRTRHALRGAIHSTHLSMTALSLHDPLCSALCKLPTQLSLRPCNSLFVLALSLPLSLEVCCHTELGPRQQFTLKKVRG